MGPTIDAVSDVGTYIKHNPIIAIAGFAVSLLTSVLGFIPVVGIANILLGPALLAGMLGLVHAGRNGTAEIEDFVDSVRDNALQILGGYLLLGIALFAAVLIPVIVTVILAFVVGMGSAGLVAQVGAPFGVPGGGMMAGMGLMMVAVALLTAVVLFVVYAALQLFDMAIVAEDHSVTDALGRAWSLFKAAPLSVVGYTVMRGVIAVALTVVPVAAFFMAGIGVTMGGMPDVGSAMSLIAIAAYVLVFTPLAYVVLTTYHVAYFNRLTATVDV